MRLLNKKNLLYVLTYLLYAFGGIMFFYLKSTPKIIFIVFLIFVAIYYQKNIIDARFLKVILIVSLIYLFQFLRFNAGSLTNYFGILVIITIPFIALKILQKRFIPFFIDITYFFSYVSLAFWILVNLSSGFHAYLSELATMLKTDPSIMNESIILYAYEPNQGYLGLIRNNGGFWEPGVYATWLIIALSFNSVLTRSFRNRKSIIITVTLLTTFSTSGYIALFILVLFLILISNTNSKLKVLRIIYSIIIIGPLFLNTEFVGEKIDDQLSWATSVDLTAPTSGRILSARKSINVIFHYPLTGKDLVLPKIDEVDYTSPLHGSSYGIAGLMARVGLIVFTIYLFHLYNFYYRFLGTMKIKKSYSFLPFLAVLVVLFGESLYDEPIVLMMVYSSFILKDLSFDINNSLEYKNLLVHSGAYY